MNYTTPLPLKPQERVAIVATAGKLSRKQLDKGIAILQSWGLDIILGKSVYEADGYFAGTDSQRLADLQQMLDNPEIKAVFCARGGYGTTRIIDQVDFSGFQESPKWLIGFSDITTLHCHIHTLGIQSIHGSVVSTFGQVSEVDDSLHQLLFHGKSRLGNIPPDELNRNGMATGRLIGGNATLLANLIGTTSDYDTKGKILFIEEVGEPLYHFDRLMTQLLRAGKLSELAGLTVGGLTGMSNPDGKFNLNAKEIIWDKVKNFDFPLSFNLPVGHQPENYPLICGANYRLIVEESQTHLHLESESV